MSEDSLMPLVAATCAGLLVWSCHTNDKLTKENAALTDQVSNLESRLADYKTKSEALETASAELQGQVERFDSEDWSLVVPDVKRATEQTASDQAEISALAD